MIDMRIGRWTVVAVLLVILYTVAQASTFSLPFVLSVWGGSAVWTWDSAGDLTASGDMAISGATTFTADVTLSGSGVDLLANAAGENTLGSSAKPFATLYTQDLDCADDAVVDDDALIGGILKIDSGGTGSEAFIYGSGASGDTHTLIDLGATGNTITFKGPTSPSSGANVTMMTLTTSTMTATVGLTIPNNKDIIIATDGNTEFGTEAASAGGGYFKTLDADTSINSDGTLSVTGISTLTDDVKCQADLYVDQGGTGSEAKVYFAQSGAAGDKNFVLDGSTANTLKVMGSSDPDNAGDTACMTITTATVTANVGITLANTKSLLLATDAGSDIGASGTEVGTVWVQTIDDGDGTVDVAAALTGDSFTADANGDVVVSGTGAHKGTYIEASDGTTAITLADSTGVVTFAAAPAFGSNVPTMATSRTAWVFASNITTGTASIGTAEFEAKNNKVTIALSDAATEGVNIVWPLPDDFDKTNSGIHVKVAYLCDDATVTEGEWDLVYLSMAFDADADAALADEQTVLDTPVQNQWMLTPEMVIPAGAIDAGDHAVAMQIYHDHTDPLCNAQDVNFLGVQLGYTTSKNY